MSFKLPATHKGRMPVCIWYKNNNIYFDLFLAIVGNDGLCCGTKAQCFKLENITSLREIGQLVINILEKFQRLGDLTLDELDKLKKDPIESKLFYEGTKRMDFLNVKENEDINLTHTHCSIHYSLDDLKYKFSLNWVKRCGNRYKFDGSSSLGKKQVFVFDTPLEFTEYPEPEELGKMVMEALERCRKMGDISSGNYRLPKTIELLNGSEITIEPPRDKHFSDCEDYGVGELHQAYLYFPKEGADSSAEFYLGIAAELDCNLSEDNIRNAWEKLHGKAEFFEVKQAEHGIWGLRAEMRNKSVHRISYLLQIDESELLDCTMKLHKPNSRKKLDEKLTGLFEEFARRCKFKD